jgi:segregation and condensation protein B
MNQEKIKNILEAALMVSARPMSMAQMLSLFEKDIEDIDHALIRAALDQLREDYNNRGIELREVASGHRVQVRSEYSDWINRLYDERPPRYSRPLLETLAIVAYRQPVTRAEIEDIRGVGVSTTIIKTLQEREWIRVVGHKDVPGHPELLATTKEFLDYFNLKKLSDLPTLTEIKELTHINPDLFDTLENTRIAGEQKETTDVPETGNLETEKSEVIDDLYADDDNVVPFTG